MNFTLIILIQCVTSTSKRCNQCNGYYSNEKSHKTLCTRQSVTCVYPALRPGGPAETIVLHRQEGVFHCVRCGKALKKDQNMKVRSSATTLNELATKPIMIAGTCTPML
jgi:hypothetical protein